MKYGEKDLSPSAEQDYPTENDMRMILLYSPVSSFRPGRVRKRSLPGLGRRSGDFYSLKVLNGCREAVCADTAGRPARVIVDKEVENLLIIVDSCRKQFTNARKIDVSMC